MLPLTLKLILIVICTLECLSGVEAQRYLKDTFPATVLEDATLDTAQLLRKYKYPAESHFITTEDKYILRMFRIPKPEGRPVFLMHGLMDSSDTWIMLGPWSGLAYYLHDQGYDVWMGNARGNLYSRNHTTFDPSVDKSYWTFGWHEIGIYDLPAMIDFVLLQTNHSKLGYFGHSQGTTSFFVMCSMRPAYNSKITMMSALAPVAFAANIKTKFLGPLRNFIAVSKNVVAEFLPHNDLLLQNCFISKAVMETCLDTLWQVMGKDEKQLNMVGSDVQFSESLVSIAQYFQTMLPVIYGHLPAGCNLKQWEHYTQLSVTDRFCMYDYGPLENTKRYGRKLPPDYPLEKVRVPVGLYYTLNDLLSSEVDVQSLAKSLPNVVENHLYPHKKWNHMTMVWGSDARELAHKRMLVVMRKFE